MQTWRIHDNNLTVLAVDYTSDWMTRGFRLVSGNSDLLAHQGIGQRGLTGIRTPHNGNEPRAKALRRTVIISISAKSSIGQHVIKIAHQYLLPRSKTPQSAPPPQCVPAYDHDGHASPRR